MHLHSPGLRTDLALLELQGSSVVDHGDCAVVRTPANPTFHWGNFILLPTAVPGDEVDHWVQRFEAEFPGTAHRAFAFADAEGSHAAWRTRGFEVELDVDLAMDVSAGARPPATEAPDGIRVRPLESDDDWEQSAVVGGSDAPEDRRDGQLVFERRRALAQRGLVESGRGRWFGAFDGERLVANLGIVRLGSLARYQDVVTLADYRRRGLAGALLGAAGAWAAEDPHVQQLVIVADEQGPAISLYTRAGFTEAGRHLQVSRRS